jgi:hypothetical protein
MLKRHLKIGLALALLLPLAQASAGKGDKGGERGMYKFEPPKPLDVPKLMSKAKRYQAPTPPFRYEQWGPGKETPITIYRTGSGKGSPLRFFWFHGAGQGAENELVSRVANGLHAVGVDIELVSLPYEGKYGDLAPKLLAESPGKVLVGGHSMGGVPSQWLTYNMSNKVAGIVTMNAVTHAMKKGVPALHFLGENDYGSGILEPGYKWGDRQVVLFTPRGTGSEHKAAILREADHSGRVRRLGDHDKKGASTSEATKQMDLVVANTIKDFLLAQKLIPAPEAKNKKK